MPSVSAKQAHLMQAVAHGWKPPSSSGISVPLKVAQEFNAADAARNEHDPAKQGRRKGLAKALMAMPK